MDNDRRPRQSTAGYASQQGTLLQPQASYPVVSASDRFRQAPLAAQPPTSAPAAAASRAGSGTSAQSYGYAYEGGSQFVGSSIQQPAVAYGTQDYADQQQAPQRASQQYSQYPQNVMYNVPAQPSQPGSSQYEPVAQYQQNRDSAIEVLGTNFGVAQPQYYSGVPSEGGPTSAPSSAIAPQNVPSQYPSIGYTPQQSAPAYSTAAMTDPHPPTSHGGGYSQPAAYPQPQPQPQQDGSSNEYDDFYNTYQTELKKTFEQVRDGRLNEAAPSLDRLSEWLLHWAETLGESVRIVWRERAAELTIGLVRDDETHYQMRLKLWEEFNNCWLGLFQKQFELVEDMRTTGQRPQAPQSIIEHDFIEKMGTKLVKNCDNMEKHGLVDYQMGVWEEEITASACK
ncbi:uncharacterized protein N0V89_000613 [Didymosphaeria variabile]|uniref:Uncharacterized protein n=1 Tax=Didymosphaeria variabile TaxID=1932322 RepID=A0A9W8XUM3_9PLEO|nr:uncharacterized protein N0V89_000613 [Didymosphaeria variabile]KAJ4360054.1 hypothetical protein N0V89_000613 [Didymosphaeria variabile]